MVWEWIRIQNPGKCEFMFIEFISFEFISFEFIYISHFFLTLFLNYYSSVKHSWNCQKEVTEELTHFWIMLKGNYSQQIWVQNCQFQIMWLMNVYTFVIRTLIIVIHFIVLHFQMMIGWYGISKIGNLILLIFLITYQSFLMYFMYE